VWNQKRDKSDNDGRNRDPEPCAPLMKNIHLEASCQSIAVKRVSQRLLAFGAALQVISR
jgi:hypothetical protein